jgi:hypothetical protein
MVLRPTISRAASNAVACTAEQVEFGEGVRWGTRLSSARRIGDPHTNGAGSVDTV